MFYRINWHAATRHVLLETAANSAPAPIGGTGMSDLGTFEYDNESEKSTGLNGMQEFSDNHVVYHHVRDVLYKQGVQNMQSIKIYIGNDTLNVPAPVITRQPSITPSRATVGDSVTINLGAATGAVGSPTWTLMRGATDVTAQVDEFMAIEFTTAGTYTLSVSWTNTTGTTNATPATITVAEAPSPSVDLATVSYMHQNGPRPFTGPANAITGYTAEGTGARAFSIVGTGADVAMDPARGPLFASGKYARNAGNTASIADGVMVLAKYAVDTASAVDTIMALTGGITVNMRWDASGNRVQYNYNVGGGAVNANGVTAAAHRDILAFEIDRVAGTLRYWDGEKIVTLTGQTITSPAFTTIDLGNSLTGVISRSNVITRGSGVAWPVRFEDVLNVYGAGIKPPFP